MIDMSWFGIDNEVILKLVVVLECVWVVIGRKGLQLMEIMQGVEWIFLYGDKSQVVLKMLQWVRILEEKDQLRVYLIGFVFR